MDLHMYMYIVHVHVLVYTLCTYLMYSYSCIIYRASGTSFTAGKKEKKEFVSNLSNQK